MNPHMKWITEGGSFPVPGPGTIQQASVHPVVGVQHPWLTDLRAMARLLRGEIDPPHKHRGDISRDAGPGDFNFSSCAICEDARQLQAEARTVADVEVLVDDDSYIGECIVRVDHGKTTITRRLVICKHGHLFTPCEYCEFDKLDLLKSYKTFEDWQTFSAIDEDRLYGVSQETMDNILRQGQR
jgi:hypothetical protein